MDTYPNIKYESENKNGIAWVKIANPTISDEFARKLWQEFDRKVLRRTYKLSVSACIRTEKDNMTCSLNNNYAFIERHTKKGISFKIHPDAYQKRFNDSFEIWVTDFIDIFEKASCDLSQGKTEDETLNNVFH